MTYQKVSNIVHGAWSEFYKELMNKGFTYNQAAEFAKNLNYADVFSSVEQCAMEAVRK